jgi:hypothetical protein
MLASKHVNIVLANAVYVQMISRVWTFVRNPRIDAQLKDKIISIVQSNRGKNTQGYSKTSCMVTIPRPICKLGGITEGSLIAWELSKHERNVFVIRILEPSTELEEGEAA